MTATYSPDDNKIRLYSVARLDAETYAEVKAAGFKWAPQQKLFVAPMWTPEREDLAIRLCGSIEDEDTSLTDRAEERAERFDGYQAHRAKDAESARQAVSAIADHIPFGQPILVGHHSEKHARKDAERIENGMRKAVKMWKTAQYWERRAAGAIRHAKYKELPTVRARRIKVLDADRRRCVRNLETCGRSIKAWGTLNQYVEDARQARALDIANVSGGYQIWGDLDKGRITPRQAQLMSLKSAARCIERNQRWIAHLDNRLTYERAMLADQGKSDLLKPKAKATQVPLCNYRAPEGLSIENKWNRGEMMHYPQVEMTQAAYASINQDYKGTRVVGHSHRVRTAMLKNSLVCVFLTDAKVHTPPDATEPPDPPARPTRERAHDAPQPAAKPAHAEKFEALAATLKAGVKVVSAPQLFPTPMDVARRMIDLAGVQAGECVLEPSAGTGNLVQAVLDAVDTEVLAYEINPQLCAAMSAKFPDYKVQVRCRDFLTVTDFQGCYQRILMNPPFEHGSDVKHIEHARTFLAPGGRLVALCADGPRQREAFEATAAEYIPLPDGTFKDQGTNVRTAIVIIDAEPAPAVDVATTEAEWSLT